MKRFFLFAAVAVTAITACTKNELASENIGNEISFQAANYVTATKLAGAEFPKTETFGTYAWTAGTAGTFFIQNNVVSYNATKDVWTTATPYYWPKNQSVDFFSYYPYHEGGNLPTVTANQITYSNVDFSLATRQVDFMYADKAVGYTDNANQVEDGQSARGGVPTFFRHAGAKVKVNVVLGENEKHETVSDTYTKWEVELTEVVLSGLYVKGSCVLNLSSTDNGIISWTKPQDATNTYYVWDPDTSLTNDTENTLFKNVQHYNLVSGTGVNVIPEFYALPQVLAADQQKIALKVNIKAYRKIGAAAEYPTDPYLTQTGKVVSADLLIDTGTPGTSVFAWQMNQAITYDITLGPAGQQITFDPAVDAWDAHNYATSIDISLGL